MSTDKLITSDSLAIIEAALIASSIEDKTITSLEDATKKYPEQAALITKLFDLFLSEANICANANKDTVSSSAIKFTYLATDENKRLIAVKCLMKRQSLVKHFSEQNLYQIACRFMLPHEKTKPLNRFKKNVTCEQGALLAFGLSKYSSIAVLATTPNDGDSDYLEEVLDLKEVLEAELQLYEDLELHFAETIDLAELEIRNTKQAPDTPEIKIAAPRYKGQYDNILDVKLSEISKLELTYWLWKNEHHDLARNVTPNFDQQKYDEHVAEQNKQASSGFSNYSRQDTTDQKTKQKQTNSNLRTKEEPLKLALGALVELIYKSKPRTQNGSKPNANAIKTEIVNKLHEYQIEPEGLSNINKDITTAWKYFLKEAG